MLALAVVAIGLTPFTERVGIVVDAVDQIEVNHFFDDAGELVFSQLIFYDWSASESRFQVVDWRLLKASAQRPTRDLVNGGYYLLWHDGEVTRRVEAPAHRETFTQHDPELRERDYLPKHLRRGLTPPHEPRASSEIETQP